MIETYNTILQEGQDEIVEKKSRFIGYAVPVSSEEEAYAFVEKIRKQHYDARHNCYAFAIGSENTLLRFSDDGEPQGTAGIPTLDVLQKADITDAVVVVTRYFGGILLGGGGLVRAYSHAASLAVEASGVLHMRQCLLAELICDYTQYGKIASLIPECVGVIDDTVFEDTVHIKFHMAHEDFQAFEKRLTDTTCGAVKAVVTGKEFFAVSET